MSLCCCVFPPPLPPAPASLPSSSAAFLPYHRRQIKGSATRRWRYSAAAAALCVGQAFKRWHQIAIWTLAWPGTRARLSAFFVWGPSSPFYLLVKILRCRRWLCALLACVTEVIKINLDQFGLLPNCWQWNITGLAPSHRRWQRRQQTRLRTW